MVVFIQGRRAEATFPNKNVAHGNPSESDEYHDADFSKVHQLVKEGKPEQALDILQIKSKNKRTRPTALILEALIWNDRDQPLKALNLAKKALQMQMQHPALQFALCQIHRSMGQRKLAKRACIITAQQHINAPETHYERAQTLMALGDMKEAGKELEKAAQLDVDNPIYQYERGLTFSYLNDSSAAEQAFRKALEIAPNHLDSAYQLAYIYAISNREKTARELIDQILNSPNTHPKQTSARVLADYINKKSVDKLPVKIEPAEYHKSRSKALYKSNKFGLSLLEIQTACQIKPNDIKTQEILVGLSGLLLRLEVSESAVRRFIHMNQSNKTAQARGYQKLGDVMVMQGKLDLAKNHYEKAIELGDPKNLAKVSLEELPEKMDVKIIPLKSSELFDNPADGLNRAGEIFAHYSMYKSALGVYSLALQMNPQHLMTMLNIGAAHFSMRQYNRAITVLEKTLVTYPTHPHIDGHRLLLAQSYVKKGDFDEGVKNLRSLFLLNSGYKKIVKTDPIFKSLSDNEDYKKLFE